ncbi:hypothetical protein HDE_14490 [Halotydeus destructor]|nr:hypothetical protein HDE_14490 [Halotydeus destructor]
MADVEKQVENKVEEVVTAVTGPPPRDWTKILLLTASALLILFSAPVIIMNGQTNGILVSLQLVKAGLAVALGCMVIYGVLMKSSPVLTWSYYMALGLLVLHFAILILRILKFALSGSEDKSSPGIWNIVLELCNLVFHIAIPLLLRKYVAKVDPSVQLPTPQSYLPAKMAEKIDSLEAKS